MSCLAWLRIELAAPPHSLAGRLPEEQFPALTKYMARVIARPAFVKTWKEYLRLSAGKHSKL